MKVFITKYALTKGIIETECKISETSPSMVYDKHNYYHKPYWHENKQDAINQCEKMRNAKLRSLRISIQKIISLKFN
jgi:hypothetical protein